MSHITRWAGLIMDLGFAMSAIGMPITAAWGLQDDMRVLAALGAVTFVLARLLTAEQQVRKLLVRRTRRSQETDHCPC